MILDTVFISRLIDEDQDAWDRAEELVAEGVDQNTTHVVLFELLYGALRTGEEDLIRRANNAIKMYGLKEMGIDELLEGTNRLAEADIKEGGNCGVGQRDGMIAGVAARNGEAVLTENVSDFRKLDVDVEEFP